MKFRSSIVLLALAGVASMSVANAADMPVKAKAPPVEIYDSWSGPYIGLTLGARWSNTTWTTTSIELPPFPLRTGNPSVAHLDSIGARVGGYGGYNWQFAPSWVVGIEGDIAWGNGKTSVSPIPATLSTGGCVFANCALDSANAKEGWDASLRGRLGFLAMPNMLIYAAGGIVWQQFELSAVCSSPTGPWCTANRNETKSWTRTGWTVGGGVETRLSRNWLARVEYRYADFGTVTNTFFTSAPGDAVVMNALLKTHTATLGVAYKF